LTPTPHGIVQRLLTQPPRPRTRASRFRWVFAVPLVGAQEDETAPCMSMG